MPSMHDMIDELNDMDCPSYSGSESISNCNYGSNNYGTNNYGFGCGFGSWIWILLIRKKVIVFQKKIKLYKRKFC